MPIQHYCNNCPHRKIPTSLKEKFNTHVQIMFDECPMNDTKVIGCTISDISIDWKSFIRWCDDHTMLNQTEKNSLKLLKLYNPTGEGNEKR